MLLFYLILSIGAKILAFPLTEKETSATCPNGNQTPTCCQLVVPLTLLGKAIEVGIGCENLKCVELQYPTIQFLFFESG